MRVTNKTKIKVSMFVALIGVLSLTIGMSYAIFNTVIISDENQIIMSGAIALKYTETNEGLKQLNLEEQTDETGSISNNYYAFSLENIGSEKSFYEITLIDDGKNTLSDEYIKANIEIDNELKPIINLKTSNRILYQDIIDKGEIKNYKLRIWINFDGLSFDEKVKQLNNVAYFKVKVNVKQI